MKRVNKMQNEGKIKVEWIIIFVLFGIAISFCLFLMSRATSKEMVQNIGGSSFLLLLSAVGVSSSIYRIGFVIRQIVGGVKQSRERGQAQTRRTESYQRKDYNVTIKDYFSESNLKENEKRDLNLYVEKRGLHRVILYENDIQSIVRKLWELGEKEFFEEAYCYFGVADRDKKWILTRYAKEKVTDQEKKYKEKYIVLSQTEQGEFQVALLEGETDIWGNLYGSYKTVSDDENILREMQEFIMPAIMYMNKADGYEGLMDKIEKEFHMLCSEYRKKNYEQILKIFIKGADYEQRIGKNL